MSRGKERHKAKPDSVTPFGKPQPRDGVNQHEEHELPQFHGGGTVTGRWSDQRPKMVEIERPICGAKAESLAALDYSELERRVMSSMAASMGGLPPVPNARQERVIVVDTGHSGKIAHIEAVDPTMSAIMAHIAESVEYQLDREVFGERVLRVSGEFNQLVLEKTLRMWLAFHVGSMVANMKDQMDEEGCGAVFAEIALWKEQP